MYVLLCLGVCLRMYHHNSVACVCPSMRVYVRAHACAIGMHWTYCIYSTVQRIKKVIITGVVTYWPLAHVCWCSLVAHNGVSTMFRRAKGRELVGINCVHSIVKDLCSQAVRDI